MIPTNCIIIDGEIHVPVRKPLGTTCESGCSLFKHCTVEYAYAYPCMMFGDIHDKFQLYDEKGQQEGGDNRQDNH